MLSRFFNKIASFYNEAEDIAAFTDTRQEVGCDLREKWQGAGRSVRCTGIQ